MIFVPAHQGAVHERGKTWPGIAEPGSGQFTYETTYPFGNPNKPITNPSKTNPSKTKEEQ